MHMCTHTFATLLSLLMQGPPEIEGLGKACFYSLQLAHQSRYYYTILTTGTIRKYYTVVSQSI